MMKLSILGVILLLIFSSIPIGIALEQIGSASAQSLGEYEIFLLSRQFVPSPGISASTEANITRSPLERVHVLVQLYHIPNATERKALEEAGVNLLAYIPNNAWFASIQRDTLTGVVDFPLVRWVGDILPEDKISPIIRESRIPPEAINPDGTVNLSIMFFEDESFGDASQVISDHSGIVKGRAPITNALVVIVSTESISAIANEDSVQWIDILPGPPIELNDGSRAMIGVNTVQAPPYNLNGTDVIAGEWDGGWVDTAHPDLVGRVTIGDPGSSSTEDHATHVAGTMLGNGSLSAGQYRGMAPSARVISYEWWADVPELELEYNGAIKNGINLSTNSWGFTQGHRPYGGYGEECKAVDDVVRGYLGKAIPIMWAAGNSRPHGDNGEYDSIIQPGTAKNTITVGAINSDNQLMTLFSSWGPTDDGRIKPDVVAAGCEGTLKPSDWYSDPAESIWSAVQGNTYNGGCGTSMATPAVSGSVALMLQDYRNTHDTVDPWPSTIKALLIHTATDLNNTGPDYTTGYGRINVQDAIDMIRDDAACCNVIIENNISAVGEMDNYTIEVPAGTSELKVTLVWTDYPGTPNGGKKLMNDLDLMLKDPNDDEKYPWTLDPSTPAKDAERNKRDDLNNVEQVYVTNPIQGTWNITVNETVLPYPIQNYTLVCSLPMKEEEMPDVKWSIEKGLCWLHHNQNPDGSWSYTGRSGKGEKSPVGYSEKGGTRESVGVTSLAALAFLNAGCDESVPTVSKAINWILSNKQSDGSIQTGWGVYDTNMAILALVATYNSDYNDPKQDAMDYIISAQNDDGDGLTTSDYQYGGWGYYRDDWGWSDLSNTQFALMALDAVQLDEDSAVWTKADEYFITRCQNREATNPDYNFHDDGGFIYLPNSTIWAGGQSYGSMTAAGVWSLLLCGVDPTTDGRLQDALDWLDNQHYHVDQNYPMGNTWAYYYILTFVKAYTMAEAKGWNSAHNWYEDASNFLINNQASDGHWPNIEGDESCDVLATTEAILSLQVREIPQNIQRLSYLTFILCSNADLHVYDPLGRHVGKNYDTGGIDLEIPNAAYTSNGVQNITIPGLEIGNYRIVLVGTGDGEYTLNVTGGVGDSTVSEDSYTETILEGEVHEATVNVAIITGLTIHVDEPEPISIDNDIALFFNGLWLADTNGNREADLFFWYGGAEGDIPLTGDCNRDGTGDIAVFNGGLWLVDTNSDLEIDSIFMYGFAGATPLVGDINQDGTDDLAVVNAYGGSYRWFVDTNGDLVADEEFWYGFEGSTPLVGDIDRDGTDDIAIVCTYGGNYMWFVDTNRDLVVDMAFWYGAEGHVPLVGDINRDGTDDVAVYNNGPWFVDTNGDHVADEIFGYGVAGATPLVGNIG